MQLIHRLFGAKADATVLCPRCERTMEGHSDADCQRKMSRRFFFGAMAGGVIAATIAKPAIDWVIEGVTPCQFTLSVNGGPITIADILAGHMEFVRPKLQAMFGRHIVIANEFKRADIGAIHSAASQWLQYRPPWTSPTSA